MGRKHYPTVEILVDDITFETAEMLLEKIEKHRQVEQTNKESKYERKEYNGDIESNGYLKYSFEIQHNDEKVEVYASYSTGDNNNLEITYQSDRVENTEDFNNALNVFEKVIYCTVTRNITEDTVRMRVTTKSH